eukprot:GHRQ01030344.1.p2 GENE.GHRQ01030344.1~~GHRQ01030344.1.p2  ORF type:complete len:127 (+),score=34.72 GHRQ01030344.1:313-693(+)
MGLLCALSVAREVQPTNSCGGSDSSLQDGQPGCNSSKGRRTDRAQPRTADECTAKQDKHAWCGATTAASNSSKTQDSKQQLAGQTIVAGEACTRCTTVDAPVAVRCQHLQPSQARHAAWQGRQGVA